MDRPLKLQARAMGVAPDNLGGQRLEAGQARNHPVVDGDGLDEVDAASRGGDIADRDVETEAADAPHRDFTRDVAARRGAARGAVVRERPAERRGPVRERIGRSDSGLGKCGARRVRTVPNAKEPLLREALLQAHWFTARTTRVSTGLRASTASRRTWRFAPRSEIARKYWPRAPSAPRFENVPPSSLGT